MVSKKGHGELGIGQFVFLCSHNKKVCCAAQLTANNVGVPNYRWTFTSLPGLIVNKKNVVLAQLDLPEEQRHFRHYVSMMPTECRSIYLNL